MAYLSRYRFEGDDSHLLAEATQRALRDQNSELRRRGVVTPISYGSVSVRFGDALQVDPSVGPMTVRLPTITPSDVGRGVLIANRGASTNAVTILSETATINGQPLTIVERAYWVRELVAIAPNLWVLFAVQDGALSAGSPRRWSYLSTTAPAGAAAPVDVWQFDGSAGQLTGRVGLIALTYVAGTPQVGISDEMQGVSIHESGGNNYLTAGAAAPLQLTGDMTLEAVITDAEITAHTLRWIACGDPAATIGTARWCYGLQINNNTPRLMRYGHSGANLDSTARTLPGYPRYWAFTRISSTVRIYCDGIDVGGGSVAAVPTAVATSEFRIGREQNAASWTERFVVHSVRVTASGYTPAQIAAAYAQVRA